MIRVRGCAPPARTFVKVISPHVLLALAHRVLVVDDVPRERDCEDESRCEGARAAAGSTRELANRCGGGQNAFDDQGSAGQGLRELELRVPGEQCPIPLLATQNGP